MQLLNILVAFDLHHVVDDENDLGIVNQHLLVFLNYIFSILYLQIGTRVK